MKTLVYDPYVSEAEITRYGGVKTDLKNLLKTSDFITIHLRLTAETKDLIGDEELSLMKSGAYLINTSRGAIIDQNALYSTLKSHRIAGAALDVYDIEPLDPNSPLLRLENITMTPHIAGVTREEKIYALKMTFDNISQYLKGKSPQFIINSHVH